MNAQKRLHLNLNICTDLLSHCQYDKSGLDYQGGPGPQRWMGGPRSCWCIRSAWRRWQSRGWHTCSCSWPDSVSWQHSWTACLMCSPVNFYKENATCMKITLVTHTSPMFNYAVSLLICFFEVWMDSYDLSSFSSMTVTQNKGYKPCSISMSCKIKYRLREACFCNERTSANKCRQYSHGDGAQQGDGVVFAHISDDEEVKQLPFPKIQHRGRQTRIRSPWLIHFTLHITASHGGHFYQKAMNYEWLHMGLLFPSPPTNYVKVKKNPIFYSALLRKTKQAHRQGV